jgi:hypothetical protein
VLEERLQAQADAEEGPVGGDPVADRVVKARGAQQRMQSRIAPGLGRRGVGAVDGVGVLHDACDAPAASHARWTLRRLPMP